MFAILVSIFYSSAFAADFSFLPSAIYGEDSRREVCQEKARYWRDKADSTVAIMGVNQLRMEGPMTHIENESFSEWINLCPGEAYEKQMAGANCSGALVGEDLILTAGHCVEGENACAEMALVFGYALSQPEETAVEWVPTQEVYLCQKIVASGLKDFIDYAVVRLDRKVQGHKPLPIRRNGRPTPGTGLVIIGHPSGLPTKIADGARIRYLESDYFVANLDSFQGNSGSAVFNSETGDIEGILVRGDEDWEWDAKKSCRRPHRCPNDGCEGEDVSYIDQAWHVIP
jgi:hypothetical protein